MEYKADVISWKQLSHKKIVVKYIVPIVVKDSNDRGFIIDKLELNVRYIIEDDGFYYLRDYNPIWNLKHKISSKWATKMKTIFTFIERIKIKPEFLDETAGLYFSIDNDTKYKKIWREKQLSLIFQ
jgi:hypothetical protein